jgi:hypothetical protein
MGFFSWLTADTKETIPNIYSKRKRKPVYLVLPEGNLKENGYGGYGEFCGFDAYALLALKNGDGYDRDKGIHIFFSEEHRTGQLEFCLKFSFNPKAKYDKLPPSEDCPNQGYFYPELNVGGIG